MKNAHWIKAGIDFFQSVSTILLSRWLLGIARFESDMYSVRYWVTRYIDYYRYAFRWYNGVEIRHQFRAYLLLRGITTC